MIGQRLLALSLAFPLVAGCETDPARGTGYTFGDSVRNAIAMQTASPAATGPELDGVRALGVLRAYRQVVTEFDKIMARNPSGALTISAGGSGK
jgi:hypothetical protein